MLVKEWATHESLKETGLDKRKEYNCMRGNDYGDQKTTPGG